MKKRLLGLLLMPIIIGGMSITNASDTSCWEGLGTVPTTTYASGIVYGCDGEIPIITIYGDNGNGKSFGITIKAMNEGTGTVTIGSLNDTGAYGSLYQWGNNYPFPNVTDTTPIIYQNSTIFAEGYGPNSAYYISRIWIKEQEWDSSNNKNLWGGSGDAQTGNGFWGYDTMHFQVVNASDRKAMCPEGYHIPSLGEWNALLYLWGNNSNTHNYGYPLNELQSFSEGGTEFSKDMQMPILGYRSYDTTAYTGNAHYWSSSPSNRYNEYGARSLYLYSKRGVGVYTTYDFSGFGNAVRCFKNSYVKLPKTLNLFFMSDDEEVGTETITENMIGSIPASAENMSRTGYELLGWIRSGANTTEIFEFATTPISGDWADESDNIYFIAQWTGIRYEIKFEAGDGTGTMENQTFTYDVAQNLTANAFTRDGYTFSGWTDGTTGYTDGQEVINLTTTSGDVITLRAEWTKIETKPSGGSSGGGGRSSQTSSDSENKNDTGEKIPPVSPLTEGGLEQPEGQNDVSLIKGGADPEITNGEAEGFTPEFQEAYEFAKEKGITTMPTIQQANMNGKLTRIAMAKMLSYYAINVLGQKPDTARINKFNDITEKLDAQYDSGVTLAYQLGIMGINMPNNNFRPNDEVTRAEFATALSRMLYSTPDGKPYYATHLAKLKAEGILTNDDYKMKELRGYVMIMLKRSAK